MLLCNPVFTHTCTHTHNYPKGDTIISLAMYEALYFPLYYILIFLNAVLDLSN